MIGDLTHDQNYPQGTGEDTLPDTAPDPRHLLRIHGT